MKYLLTLLVFLSSCNTYECYSDDGNNIADINFESSHTASRMTQEEVSQACEIILKQYNNHGE